MKALLDPSVAPGAPGFWATLLSMSTIEAIHPAGAALDWLERIASDWSLLKQLSARDRGRFHRALAALATADPRANPKPRPAAHADAPRRAEAVLIDTGIRALRRRPVVTTPNVFPPNDPARRSGEAATAAESRTTNDEPRTTTDEPRTTTDEP